MPINFNYIILDPAIIESAMATPMELNSAHLALYTGGPDEEIAEVGPYIFTSEKDTPFEKWFINEGWGNSWGIMLKSEYPLVESCKHFQKFLIVKTEEGEYLDFRFNDPRVLRIFLPTCDENQLREFFGPIEQFICEDEDPGFALVFSFEKNTLKTQRITTESLFETSEQKNQGRKFFV